jgi:hypothetical protein
MKRFGQLLLSGTLSLLLFSLVRGAESAGVSAPDSYKPSQDAEVIDEAERASVLRELSGHIRANREAIRTWTGRFRFHDETRITAGQADAMLKPATLEALGLKPPFVQDDRGGGRFVVDAAANALYVELSCDSRKLREQHGSGEKKLDEATYWQRSILTPEHYLHIRPDKTYGAFELAPHATPSQTRAGFRDTAATGQDEHWGFVVDPRKLFDASRDMSEELTRYAKLLDEGGQRGGGLLIREWASDKGMRRRVEINGVRAGDGAARMDILTTFAEEAGFNPVRFDVLREGNTAQYMTWQYQQTDGVFLPAKVLRMVVASDGKSVGFQRAISVSDSKLNESVEGSVFTIAGLELKEGERLLDRIESKLFVVSDGVLRRIDNLPQLEVPAGGAGMRWFVFLNVAVIGVILFLLYKQRRSESGRAGGP